MIIKNLIVGIILIAAIIFIVLVFYCFFSKPNDVIVVQRGDYFYLNMKRHLIWDLMEDGEEVLEFWPADAKPLYYPFKTEEDAQQAADLIKQNLKK